MKCLLFPQVYCNQPLVFFEEWIIKQITSCVVGFLTCDNFPNVFICPYVIFYWLTKKVSIINRNVAVFCFYFCKKVSCVHCYDRSILVTQKVCWFLENLDQSGNLNSDFIPALILLIDIFSSWFFV